MIHTNDEISDLIVRSTQLVLKIEDMIKNEDEHNCAYRVVYRTHDLLVTKILEELHYKNEKFLKTKNKSIFVVKPKIEPYEKLSKSLANLINLAKNGKLEECYKIMSAIVPEYKKTKVENLQNKRVV